ncbi:SdrD B-like domain-containing protein, partial [Lewinella sp. W8]|uniref:SdrD B-like domain-containing protein n=1 Tax=Lewinella sp. W8 TaxID=2528208 RepID=UPI001429693F
NVGDDATDSDADETTGQSPVVILASGENNPTIDAGFYETASLGDFVFEDVDGDGIQDAGEPGVPNVTVNLKDENGNVIASTTTAGDGSYSFDNLVPGDYSVQFVLPGGFEYTDLNEGGDEALDSDA